MLRLFQKTNKESFARSLEQADWNKVYNESDINVAYNAFSNTIKNSYDRNFKLVKLSMK